MLESSIGVALPPTSLMRARTIGQIATLIAEQMGSDNGDTPKPVVAEAATSSEEIDLDSISDADLDLLLGSTSEPGDDTAAGKNLVH
jgi:acyl carrier protein